MTIVRLEGGLGNQMFQYAFAKALESKGESVALDISRYTKSKDKKDKLKDAIKYIFRKNKSKSPSSANNQANIRDQYATCNYDSDTNRIRKLEIARFDIKITLYTYAQTSSILCAQDKLYIFFKLIRKPSFLIPKARLHHPYKYCIEEVFDSSDLSALPHDTLKNALMIGYFQKLSYFRHIDSAIRADFTLRTPLLPANEAMKKHILSTPNAVFIHIRRGDYLNLWDYVNLGKVYYESAIKAILACVENPRFFIFSNDIEWCKNKFINLIDSSVFAGKKYEFVEQNDEGNAIEELELMRSCKHGIIANSTFSWWAAYLMENPQKVIITPSKFFWTLPPQRPNHPDDILPEGWIKIDPTWGNIAP